MTPSQLAPREAKEQGFRPAGPHDPRSVRDAACSRLPLLHLLPERVVDDAQLGYVCRDPFGRRIQTGGAFARVSGFLMYRRRVSTRAAIGLTKPAVPKARSA